MNTFKTRDVCMRSKVRTKGLCMRCRVRTSGVSITSRMKTRTRGLGNRDHLIVHEEPSRRALAFEALPRHQGTTPPSCFGAGHVKMCS